MRFYYYEVLLFIFGMFFVFYGIKGINGIISIKAQYLYNINLFFNYFQLLNSVRRVVIYNLNLIMLINNLLFIYGGVLVSINCKKGKYLLCLGLILEYFFIYFSEYQINEMNISPLFTYFSLLSCILNL